MNKQIKFINLLRNNLIRRVIDITFPENTFFFFFINTYLGDCVVFLEMFFERSLWLLQRERNGSLKTPLVLELSEEQDHTLSLLFKKFHLGSGQLCVIQWMFSERKLAVASYSLWQSKGYFYEPFLIILRFQSLT